MNKIVLVIIFTVSTVLYNHLGAGFDQGHFDNLVNNCTDPNSNPCKELQKICHLDDNGKLQVSQKELLSELGYNNDNVNDCGFITFGLETNKNW